MESDSRFGGAVANRLCREIDDQMTKGQYLNAAHACAELTSVLLSLLSSELKKSTRDHCVSEDYDRAAPFERCRQRDENYDSYWENRCHALEAYWDTRQREHRDEMQLLMARLKPNELAYLVLEAKAEVQERGLTSEAALEQLALDAEEILESNWRVMEEFYGLCR